LLRIGELQESPAALSLITGKVVVSYTPKGIKKAHTISGLTYSLPRGPKFTFAKQGYYPLKGKEQYAPFLSL